MPVTATTSVRVKEIHLVPPPHPERIVKQRKPYRTQMSIVVSDEESGVALYPDSERAASVQFTPVGLMRYLRDHWPRDSKQKRLPVMWVCMNPHRVLLELHTHYEGDPQWNFRLTKTDGERFYIDGTVRKPKISLEGDTRIGFFGFTIGRSQNQYVYPLSPLDYMNSFREYQPDYPMPARLYAWGRTVLQFCKRNGLKPSSSKGGLAAQLLTDGRFYPEPRRKVPVKTNEKARKALPGNYYRVTPRATDRVHARVIVIDQMNAHHYAAQTVKLPNANTLFAHGRFLREWDKPWVRRESWQYRRQIEQYGLFRVCALVPRHLKGPYLPDWAETHNPGMAQYLYLYSNEIPLAERLGIDIRGISYCFTSPETDTGLAQYASWAETQVENVRTPYDKQWLKGTLLSAYGMLGVRARKMETAYLQAKLGEQKRYMVGPVPITLYERSTKREIQHRIANCVQRGMIEAETRKLSIELAHKLEGEGHLVLNIHADAVVIADNKCQLPLLPPPWRVKDTLTHWTSPNGVSWYSDQKVLQPGRKPGRGRSLP